MHFALDIILNNRLHCSDWRKLNDPMEGKFGYSYRTTDEQDHSNEVDEIINHKRELVICSLSKTFNSHLLWAHYASGFSGLAIEVELPDGAHNVRVVEYCGVFGHVSFDRVINPEQAAEEILSSKYQEWRYEQEVRILQRDEWYAYPLQSGGLSRATGWTRLSSRLCGSYVNIRRSLSLVLASETRESTQTMSRRWGQKCRGNETAAGHVRRGQQEPKQARDKDVPRQLMTDGLAVDASKSLL